MRPEIPLEILGLVGPLLSWAENAQSQAIPKAWAGEPTSGADFQVRDIHEPDTAAHGQERGWLLEELPTFSLDNVDEVVDYSRGNGAGIRSSGRWQPSPARMAAPPGYDLWHIFEALAERYLIWNGGKVAIRSGRMVELHELGLRMPLGFIVRHVHARAVAAGEQHLRDVTDLPESVSLLPSNSHGLRTVIRRGLSEGHLHLNAVHATEVAWADHLLKPIRFKPQHFGAVEWRLLRLARAVVRLLALATAFARIGAPSATTGWTDLLKLCDAMYFAPTEAAMTFYEERFKAKLGDLVSQGIRSEDLDRADRWTSSRVKSRHNYPHQGRLGLLHWLDPHQQTHHWSPKEVARDYRALISPVERERCLALLHLAAHLALIETPRTRQRRRELSVSRRSNFLEKIPRWSYPTAEGRFLHQVLFRYLIVQTHHWQLGVQQGRTTGLRHFKKYYESNQRWPILPTSREQADAVLRRARDWRGLRVLEGRVGPPEQGRDLLPWLSAFAARAREGRVEKMGLVVHFIKERESKRARSALFRARFSVQRSSYRRQAISLFRILEQPSLVTPFIVGIDAANLELATPPEVFAPVFRFLRDRPIALNDTQSMDLSAWPMQREIRDLVDQRRLGMTYHVGEEFRHLLSGLRAIDEVLQFLAPRSGDRIGHGIALGLDPEVWLSQVGRQALVPKQEWLDTLVWIHQLLGTGHDALGRLKVEEKIEQLGRELYLSQQKDSGRIVTPLLFRNVWLLRQLDPEMFEIGEDGDIQFQPLAGDDSATWRWNCVLRQMLHDVQLRVGLNAPTDLLSRYWYSPITKAKGEELLLVDMESERDSWFEVCCEAQQLMQGRIAERQVAVEVNPSVNRVIGPMSRFSDHHIFKLTFDAEGQWKRWLRVSVNTDNPATANTCLTHEYYLLGEALISSGVPEAEVVEWLEWLRRSGEESSFVRQLPDPKSLVMRRLKRRLRAIRRPLRDIRDPDTMVRELWKRLR